MKFSPRYAGKGEWQRDKRKREDRDVMQSKCRFDYSSLGEGETAEKMRKNGIKVY